MNTDGPSLEGSVLCVDAGKSGITEMEYFFQMFYLY